MKVGMVAEATCISKPWTVIPMVVTGVQDYIAAGQFRGGEQLIDAQQVARPGTILVFLEPLYAGGLDGVTPGSSCIANAYTSNHDLIDSGRSAPQGPRSSRGGCGRPRARHDPADPGAALPSRPSCFQADIGINIGEECRGASSSNHRDQRVGSSQAGGAVGDALETCTAMPMVPETSVTNRPRRSGGNVTFVLTRKGRSIHDHNVEDFGNVGQVARCRDTFAGSQR